MSDDKRSTMAMTYGLLRGLGTAPTLLRHMLRLQQTAPEPTGPTLKPITAAQFGQGAGARHERRRTGITARQQRLRRCYLRDKVDARKVRGAARKAAQMR
jgi:hypothetical protein